MTLILGHPWQTKFRGKLTLLEVHGYIRLYEDYYFLASGHSPEQAKVIRSFFDWLSPKYDSQNIRGRNAECYNCLLQYSEISRDTSPSILDFGCGSGTILESTVPAVAGQLHGYDISPKMTAIARKRGINVLSHLAFETLPRGSVDLIISAYVLHYGIGKKIFNHLLSLLAPNGSLVANFHKGIGADLLFGHIDSLKRSAYSSHWSHTQFGRCVRIRKDRSVTGTI